MEGLEPPTDELWFHGSTIELHRLSKQIFYFIIIFIGWIGFEPMRRISMDLQSTAIDHSAIILLILWGNEKNGNWTHISNLDKVVL